MKDRDFINELKAKFDRPAPDSFKIFNDIYSLRKLAYCHWQTEDGVISIDYSIVNNEVKQITLS